MEEEEKRASIEACPGLTPEQRQWLLVWLAQGYDVYAYVSIAGKQNIWFAGQRIEVSEFAARF